MLSEAYKSQADLEVQLNVAKSNLQLVISNNEMLEEALKRDSASHGRDVGWRRASARESDRRLTSASDEVYIPPTPDSAGGTSGMNSPVVAPSTPTIAPSTPNTAQETSRFFRFRFTGSSPNPSSVGGSRPGTPVGHDTRSPIAHHLNSPSLPALPTHLNNREKEIEEELEKEKAKRKKAEDDKEALEAELESLSQALFEEVS